MPELLDASAAMAMIFISYRREDADFEAHSLCKRLRQEFGEESVMIDVDSIPPGVDFRRHLSESVRKCGVLLAVVGDRWLNAKSQDGQRRLDDPADFVRIEIEHALARKIPVIPVVFGPVPMPRDFELPDPLRDFAFRNAILVRSGKDFEPEIERLIQWLKKLEETPPDKGEDVLRLLAELVKGTDNVAKPPADLERAIKQGLSEVASALTEFASAKKPIRLDDVEHIIGTAIGHGAGIYNHSQFGRVGCGRIYHYAAAGLLKLMPETSPSSIGPLPHDVNLATAWLRRIIAAVPLVEEPTGDDLAWELRFAFDSIHYVPFCDNVRNELAGAEWRGASRQPICDIVGEVLQRCQAIRQAHVAAYVMRHTAQVVALLIEKHKLTDPVMVEIQTRLSKIVAAHPRIVRQNFAELSRTLHEALLESCGKMAATGSHAQASDKNWFNPRAWFSNN